MGPGVGLDAAKLHPIPLQHEPMLESPVKSIHPNQLTPANLPLLRLFRTASQTALWLQISAWSMSLLRDLGWEASASLRWLKVRRKLLPVFKPSHHRLLVQVVLHGSPEKKALDSRLLTTSFGQSLWTTRRKFLSVMSGALVLSEVKYR